MPRKIVLFILILFLSAVNFSLLAQNPDLRPAATQMLSRSIEEKEGSVITHYLYESASSQKEITKFYRLLFKNRGFKESRGQGSSANFIFFAKQDEGLIVVLTFLGQAKKGRVTYSLTNHHFSLPRK